MLLSHAGITGTTWCTVFRPVGSIHIGLSAVALQEVDKRQDKRHWTTRLIPNMAHLGKQCTTVRPGESIHENTHLLGWWLCRFYSVCCSTNHTRNMCRNHIQAMVMGSRYLLSEPPDYSFPRNRRILRQGRQSAPRHRMSGRERRP